MKPKSWWKDKPEIGWPSRETIAMELKYCDMPFGLLHPYKQKTILNCDVEYFRYDGIWTRDEGWTENQRPLLSMTYRVRRDFQPQYAPEPKPELPPCGCEDCQARVNIDEWCHVPYPGNGAYSCSRKSGHTGDHVACGYDEHNLRRWPQEKPEPQLDPSEAPEGYMAVRGVAGYCCCKCAFHEGRGCDKPNGFCCTDSRRKDGCEVYFVKKPESQLDPWDEYDVFLEANRNEYLIRWDERGNPLFSWRENIPGYGGVKYEGRPTWWFGNPESYTDGKAERVSPRPLKVRFQRN